MYLVCHDIIVSKSCRIFSSLVYISLFAGKTMKNLFKMSFRKCSLLQTTQKAQQHLIKAGSNLK